MVTYKRIKKDRKTLRMRVFILIILAVSFIAPSMEFAMSDMGFLSTNSKIDKYCQEWTRYYHIKNVSLEKVEDAILSTIQLESGFKANSKSWEPTLKAYSYGLMRIVASTARFMGWHGKRNTELLDPDTNLKYGIKYFCYQLARYHGSLIHAILAYNAGGVYRNAYSNYINYCYLKQVYGKYYTDLRNFRNRKHGV